MSPFKTDHEGTLLIEAGHILTRWQFLCDGTKITCLKNIQGEWLIIDAAI